MPYADPIRQRQALTEWRRNNREKVRRLNRDAKAKERAADPDKIRARVKAWRDAHPGYHARKMKEARANDPSRIKANEKLAANKRRALKRSCCAVRITRAAWGRIVDQWGNQCVYCGGAPETMDHVVPLSRGGAHEPSNVVPACRSCNARKGTKLPQEWLKLEDV